ncbi:putative vacuolar protein sorting-associated protein 26 protein [Botrytis fragariae]|uniref:Putative vacuolar protein sorting-associated protein 26 protein n=1 Tax=Botrytis fragariae TaxID=1964551 RepID=A0A8H6AF03_9HELO|nr:putative vacuolar protein sorting-associated protein 26 protein [Botrytis fragariae]KAF5867578.1 putative vacuolar protein sorting-associated protein 26 protein [Botrytis fragariae]
MAYRNPLDGEPPELLHESYSGKSTRTPRTRDIPTYGTEYYLSEQTGTSGRSVSGNFQFKKDRIAPFTPINSEFAPGTEPDNSVATATSNFHGVIVDELDRKLKRDQVAASRTIFEDEQAEHQDLTYIDSLQAAHIYQASDKQVVIGQFQPSLSKINSSLGIEVCRGFDSDFQETGRLHRKANIDKLTDHPSLTKIDTTPFFPTTIDMSFLFSAPVDIDIVLEDGDSRETVEVKNKSSKERVPLYKDGESVRGAVTIRPKDGKRLEHTGIKVQFIGMIEMFYDRGNHYEFLSLGQELAAPGDLQHPQAYDFNFKNVEKQYESYNGINVKLRYFIKVTVSRRMADVIREKDLWVFSYRIPPEMNSSIKMDVGIEDCLHIEFEYSKSKYHLKDVIVGRIYFLLVRLKIKHMELSIIRRETTGTPPNQYNESETLVRFEIMDGSPSRGETIPIRLFLGGFDLTPTFREVNKKYSTRYYLSLVLIDEDARRYFKQSEIVLYRQQPEDALALGQQTKIAGAHSAPSPAAQKRLSAQ